MACNIDEEIPKFKHYCRVCKKGFMCGRALGGHMRAHGIGDIDNGILDDEDDDNDSSDSEEKYGGSDFGTGIKRMYKLRTNPNRLKSCRNCEHCGKEFFSWKSFLEHGKCGSNDTSESLVSSPSESAGEYYGGRQVGGWSKRKRSFRANVSSINSTSLSSEEEDLHLARCLIQLSNTKVDSSVVAEPEESCASASREEMEERRNPRTLFGITTSRPNLDNKAKGHITPKGFFECTTCKKVFNSHQALGGHRASHKKVKGCYAAKLEQQQQLDETSLADDNVITREEFLTSSKYYQYEQAPTLVGAAKRKSKVHECSICHKVFSTGQALGGHKRCHWITSNSPDTSSLAKFQFQDKNTYQSIQTHPKTTNIRQSDTLDLNSFPPWTEDMSRIKRNQHNPFSFEVSTDMHLHTWTGRDSNTPRESQLQYHNRKNDDGVTNENNIINLDSDMKIVENDEADNALKYAAKLSNLKDLKDLKDDKDNSSQWLQVGIGSTTEASVDI